MYSHQNLTDWMSSCKKNYITQNSSCARTVKWPLFYGRLDLWHTNRCNPSVKDLRHSSCDSISNNNGWIYSFEIEYIHMHAKYTKCIQITTAKNEYFPGFYREFLTCRPKFYKLHEKIFFGNSTRAY